MRQAKRCGYTVQMSALREHLPQTVCWLEGSPSATCASSSSITRGWDQHTNLPQDIAHQCKSTDQPAAALIKDLMRRGLLEDTLVIWAGEFGRTPMLQATPNRTSYGRDHHMEVL